jgi:hypothetical protein
VVGEQELEIPSWAFLMVSFLVSTTIPSETGLVQAVIIIGPRGVSISTRHMRHMPTGCHAGMPAEAGDVGAVVLGGLDEHLAGAVTSTSLPSIVTFTMSLIRSSVLVTD